MEQFDGYQRKSAELLDRALAEVPFYRDNWRAYDPGPERPAAERFAALPVLTKADLRAGFPGGFVCPREPPQSQRLVIL